MRDDWYIGMLYLIGGLLMGAGTIATWFFWCGWFLFFVAFLLDVKGDAGEESA